MQQVYCTFRSMPAVVLTALVVLLTSCLAGNPKANVYITWDSLEPDTWASIWLIKRHIDPNAEIVLRPTGAPTDSGIAFGVPDAIYTRTRGNSVYESLRQGFHQDAPELQGLGQIIQDIEISPWAENRSSYSKYVETSFRGLQESFESRNVPVDCFGRFFDRVYGLLQDKSPLAEWNKLDDMAHADPACHKDGSTFARRDLAPFVRRLQSHVVLDHIAADKKVMFVDVREPAEYDEFHIPGAINIPLRDLEPDMKARFDDADLVIPYCIKDFRGFEMARNLAEIGLHNVGIMQPYGIAGWRHLGLPVVSRGGMTEADALDKLAQCAHTGTCIDNPA